MDISINVDNATMLYVAFVFAVAFAADAFANYLRNCK